MEEPTNIFYKIFEIMDHYENILDNSSYEGDDKYTEGDDFFAFLFKNMKKQEAPPQKEPDTEQNPDKEPDPVPDKEIPSETESKVDKIRLSEHILENVIRKLFLNAIPIKINQHITQKISSLNATTIMIMSF